MTRKRRPYYPAARGSKRPAPASGPPVTPPTVAVINRQAGTGRPDIEVGQHVIILGDGLYAGETAIVQSVTSGVIPAALVRTEAGRKRHVRTIDLRIAPAEDKRLPNPGD